jgi:RNA polymerase sigma-54 factor
MSEQGKNISQSQSQMQSQSQGLSQNLALTPQLKQSIAILASSSYELNEILIEQQNSNPFIEVSNLFNANPNANASINNDIDNIDNIDNIQNKDYKDFRQDLCEQLNFTQLDKRQISIIEYLIENLDDNGFLEDDLMGLLELLPDYINISYDEISQALNTLKNISFDEIGAGIGAINSAEYMLIQIKNQAKNKQEIIINNHIKNIAIYLCYHQVNIKN